MTLPPTFIQREDTPVFSFAHLGSLGNGDGRRALGDCAAAGAVAGRRSVRRRPGEDIARCRVERLMRNLRIRGVVRGKKVITVNPDASLTCPDDRVHGLCTADRPNAPLVSDFTFGPTWFSTF